MEDKINPHFIWSPRIMFMCFGYFVVLFCLKWVNNTQLSIRLASCKVTSAAEFSLNI